jgi:hypothetical protein
MEMHLKQRKHALSFACDNIYIDERLTRADNNSWIEISLPFVHADEKLVKHLNWIMMKKVCSL